MSDEPIKQAKAAANQVKSIISRMTDKSIYVQPVVVFVGWWVAAVR
jgi:hypothetical protein